MDPEEITEEEEYFVEPEEGEETGEVVYPVISPNVVATYW